MPTLIELVRSENLNPRINTLYAMMNDTRKMLQRVVKDLTVAEIDYTPDDRTVETIGTLLYHIAGVEWGWIFMDIGGRELDEEKWKFGFPLRKQVNIEQISGKPITYYLNLLEEVRKPVFEYLTQISDDILEQKIDVDGELHTVEWIFYHIFEHELTHIGQIRLLKRLYKLKNH